MKLDPENNLYDFIEVFHGKERRKQAESLFDKYLDNLQWAKDFMDRYERKHGKK